MTSSIQHSSKTVKLLHDDDDYDGLASGFSMRRRSSVSNSVSMYHLISANVFEIPCAAV